VRPAAPVERFAYLVAAVCTDDPGIAPCVTCPCVYIGQPGITVYYVQLGGVPYTYAVLHLACATHVQAARCCPEASS
jgi:hypothetical protein